MKDKNNFKTVTIDGEVIVSDIPESKNVVKIFEDIAVIYTSKGEPIRIRTKDLDKFIIENTWGYYNTGYASTKITYNKLLKTCNQYNLSIEGFKLGLKEIDADKQTIVYIHRYVMGFYNKGNRQVLEVRYKNVLEQYSLKSIDDLVVDHDMNNAKEGEKRVDNYSDMMRIVPQAVNSRFGVSEPYNNQQYMYPIKKDEQSGLYQLEIKETPSPFAKTVGIITDLDVKAINVARIQNEMIAKYPSYIKEVLSFYGVNENLTPKEKVDFKQKKELELMKELIDLGKKLEEQCMVKVKMFVNPA